jgi:mono/diheme cytochrome c family protein
MGMGRAGLQRHRIRTGQVGHDAWSRMRCVAFLFCLLLVTGCSNNGMEDQPKYEPFEASTLFDNGMSARPVVENTVARGQLRANAHLYAGQTGDTIAVEFPFPVTSEVMARGQERYGIYCAPCHGYAGYGDGIIVQRGFSPPPSFHEQRLRELPVGYLFQVITNGIGAMYSYGDRIQPEDRWAIIAYMRALQLSQNATLEAVPTDMQPELEASTEEMGATESMTTTESVTNTQNVTTTNRAPDDAEGVTGTETVTGTGDITDTGAVTDTEAVTTTEAVTE